MKRCNLPHRARLRCLALVCATLIGRTSAGAERTTERFYMVVYGAQEAGVCPMSSHCFATFARIIAKDDTGSEPIVELRHINWFSRRGHETGLTHGVSEDDGRPVAPESGENRTTRDALSLAHRRGLTVTRLGPFEVDRGLYERAWRQIDLLEGRIPGRRVLYKSLDLGYREGPCASALNCIHAISDIDRERGAPPDVRLLRRGCGPPDRAPSRALDQRAGTRPLPGLGPDLGGDLATRRTAPAAGRRRRVAAPVPRPRGAPTGDRHRGAIGRRGPLGHRPATGLAGRDGFRHGLGGRRRRGVSPPGPHRSSGRSGGDRPGE
jgi:hypothetical protein